MLWIGGETPYNAADFDGESELLHFGGIEEQVRSRIMTGPVGWQEPIVDD